jgi:uncharacterized protein
VAKKGARAEKSFLAAVDRRFPGLAVRIQRLVEASERQFAGNAPEADGSFLWEHSTHVASLAFALAGREGADPALAAVAALLHDAGKFAGGRYHEDDRPEEEEAVRVATGLLGRSKMKALERAAVLRALGALYNPAASPDRLAAIVHDADFLSKFGFVGVAQFFVKSALRGKTLGQAVAQSLSKELTYAACLPLNMRTAAGKEMAERKAASTAAFFASFLEEIREVQGLAFGVSTERFYDPRRPGRPVEVRLVLPEACPSCGGFWRTSLAPAAGLKCDRLEARAECVRCRSAVEVSFCLPELAI